MNQPLVLRNRNEHFHSKKLLSSALQGDSWNENANLCKFTGWFISTLAGRFQVTADTLTTNLVWEMTMCILVRMLFDINSHYGVLLGFTGWFGNYFFRVQLPP
jgi:hypothetical protein